jgi:predicted RecB family endonuclease
MSEELKDLEYMLEAHKNRIRSTRTTLDNEEFYLRSVLDLKESIKKQQDQLDRLVNARENGEAIIEDSKAAVKQLKQKIARIKNRKKIEEIKRLQARLNALEVEE